jgi:hypothetical protein
MRFRVMRIYVECMPEKGLCQPEAVLLERRAKVAESTVVTRIDVQGSWRNMTSPGPRLP